MKEKQNGEFICHQNRFKSVPAAIKCEECGDQIAEGRFQNGRVVPPQKLKDNGGTCPNCGTNLNMNRL